MNILLYMFMLSFSVKCQNAFRLGVSNENAKLGYSFLSMMSKHSQSKEKKSFPKFGQTMYKPKTENQQKYLDYLKNENVSLILAIGPAGTGKTLFACLEAIQLLKNDKINKIIITRPIVGVGDEELGFLPGNMMKKMEPWTQPIFDVFLQYFSKAEIDNFLYNGNIEISPLAYMRGRTFRNAFVIADESQNTTPAQMKMFVTRFGENSKGIITGDLNQSDKSGQENGLYQLMQKMERYGNREELESMVKIVQFSKEDVERSKISQLMVKMYEFEMKEVSKKSAVSRNNDDAALIPKHHMPCRGDCSL